MSKTTTPKGFSGVLELLKKYNQGTAGLSTPTIDFLSDVGKETIEGMFQSKFPGNDLYNQRDAFGYGIYFNGKLVKEGYLDGELSKAPSKHRKQRGREEAKKAISQYTPLTDGYELYLVNAMHYSRAQEEFWGVPVLVDSEVFEAQRKIEDKLKIRVKVTFEH